MKGPTAFDPETGAPLSEQRHYPRDHRAVRIPDGTRSALWSPEREGALTNGQLRSSKLGLLGYFETAHASVRESPADGLDGAAALALNRLKRSAPDAVDYLVWYALAERLAQKEYWVAWMLDYVTCRCPHCTSEVKFRPGADGPEAICASAPTEHGRVDQAVRERVLELCTTTFDDIEIDSTADLILI